NYGTPAPSLRRGVGSAGNSHVSRAWCGVRWALVQDRRHSGVDRSGNVEGADGRAVLHAPEVRNVSHPGIGPRSFAAGDDIRRNGGVGSAEVRDATTISARSVPARL